MKRTILILSVIVVLYGCTSRPKNFTYSYEQTDTGLAGRIDLNGYYVSQHGCDSAFYSMYMFYPDGLFTIATTSTISPELIACFRDGGDSKICRYPLWGLYKIEGDLIKTQVIRTDGGGFVIFRDYRILPDGRLINVSDYVQPEYISLGYMENYPSFMNNSCETVARFFPLETKRDRRECPFIGKSWLTPKR